MSPPASFTTSTVVFSGRRTSSGAEKSLTSTPAIVVLLCCCLLRSDFEHAVERRFCDPAEPAEVRVGGERGERGVGHLIAQGVTARLRLRAGRRDRGCHRVEDA